MSSSSSLAALLPVRGVYLQMTLSEVFMNGLYTGLFFTTLYAMIFKRTARAANIAVYFAVIAMYILATIHVATRWFLVKTAFIDHGDSPAATLLFLLRNPLWLGVLPAIALTTNTLVADSVLIWRCWTVWNQNFIVIILPVLCTISGAVLGFLSVAEQARYIINPSLDRHTFVDFATPYFALSLVTTLLATLMIILRILMMTKFSPGIAKGYGNVIEIVVESAALYSITLIVFLPFLVSGSFNDGYPQAILVQMTGIAPTLIVARVSFGLARPDETWAEQTNSFFFGSNTQAAPTQIHLSGIPASTSSNVAGETKPDGSQTVYDAV
ncbi:hypothetical protein B0H10DRAFT_2021828 [Mycena sp. CBHHK59/15]|nr:hypothetical protein B0H10DRAFT_2021828 [Mycena sp. CBHHK59/15]